MKPNFKLPEQYEKQPTEKEILREQKIYIDNLLKQMKQSKATGKSMSLKQKGAILSYIIGACIIGLGIYRYFFFFHLMFREAITFVAIGGLFIIIGVLFSEISRIDHIQKEIEYFEDRLLDEYPELNKLRDDK